MRTKINSIAHHIQNPTTPEALIEILALFDDVDDADTYQQMYDALMQVCAHLGLKIGNLKTPEQLSTYFTSTESKLALLCEELHEAHQTLFADGHQSLSHPSVIIKSITTNVIDFAKKKICDEALHAQLASSEHHDGITAMAVSLVHWTLRYSDQPLNTTISIRIAQTTTVTLIEKHLKKLSVLLTPDFLKDREAVRESLGIMADKLNSSLPSLTQAKECQIEKCLVRVAEIRNHLQQCDGEAASKRIKVSQSTAALYHRSPLESAITPFSQYAKIRALVFDFDDTLYYLDKIKKGIIKDPLNGIDDRLIALLQFAHEHLSIEMVIHTARNKEVDNASLWAHACENDQVIFAPSSNGRIPPVVEHNGLSNIFTPDKILYSNYLKSIIHENGAVQCLSGEYNVSTKLPRFAEYLKDSGLKADEVAVFDDSLTAWSINGENQSRASANGILFHHINNEDQVKNIVSRTKIALMGIMMHSEHIALDKRIQAAKVFTAHYADKGLTLPKPFMGFVSADKQAIPMAL